MPQIHIVSKSYDDPRFDFPTVNRFRVYEHDPVKAVALVKANAASFETVKLEWSVAVSEDEYRWVRSLNA